MQFSKSPPSSAFLHAQEEVMEKLVLGPPALDVSPKKQSGSRSLFSGRQDDCVESSDDEGEPIRSRRLLISKPAKGSSKPKQKLLVESRPLPARAFLRKELKLEAAKAISKDSPPIAPRSSAFSLRSKAPKRSKDYQKGLAAKHHAQPIAKKGSLKDAPGESRSLGKNYLFDPEFGFPFPSPVSPSMAKGKFVQNVELPKKIGRYWGEKGSAGESEKENIPPW